MTKKIDEILGILMHRVEDAKSASQYRRLRVQLMEGAKLAILEEVRRVKPITRQGKTTAEQKWWWLKGAYDYEKTIEKLFQNS